MKEVSCVVDLLWPCLTSLTSLVCLSLVAGSISLRVLSCLCLTFLEYFATTDLAQLWDKDLASWSCLFCLFSLTFGLSLSKDIIHWSTVLQWTVQEKMRDCTVVQSVYWYWHLGCPCPTEWSAVCCVAGVVWSTAAYLQVPCIPTSPAGSPEGCSTIYLAVEGGMGK